ncbi:MAG: hypothetical protein SGI90_14435 [Candidatus Eisenbacteria bacterium]|nr:hypothetical protein [Candidatus Eisenbacteria bacterium]
MLVEIGGADGRILDSEYVSRRYFSLENLRVPIEPIEPQDIELFQSTRTPEADRRNGRETFGARGSQQGDGAGPILIDTVVRLTASDDYFAFTTDRARGAVIVLRNSLPGNLRLYAGYKTGDAGTPGQVGNYWSERAPGDSLSLKPLALTEADVTGTTLSGDFIDYTLRLERRNIYSLDVRDIDLNSLNLTISRIGAADPTRIDGVPLLEATGLDLLLNVTRQGCGTLDITPFPGGPDGRVDPQWIDEQNGLIFFPDLQPFDPDPFDLVDPETGEVRNPCRERVIGWELFDPTPGTPGDEGYRRTSGQQQPDERNAALYGTFRANPAEARYEITGFFEVETDSE